MEEGKHHGFHREVDQGMIDKYFEIFDILDSFLHHELLESWLQFLAGRGSNIVKFNN